MSLLTQRKYSFISHGADKETFTVVSFKGFEAISKPYEFEIILVSDKSDVDPLKILQNPAMFTIHRDGEENVDFNGILFQFEETREFDGYYFFRAVLSPKFWWLSLTHHNQVFLDLTVQEIMEHALKDGGLVSGIDFEFRLQGAYEKVEYVCQYDESHFDFVSRWAQREGIYYFFEQTSNGEKIVFTDTKISHKDLLLGKDLDYEPPSGLDAVHTKEVVKTFLCKHNLLPQRVYLKDYNYLKPSLAIEGIADVDENGRGENYVYGVHFDTPEQGSRLAQIRAESLLCRKSVFNGESAVPYIVPGYTFDLKDHYKDAYNRKYLITEVTHGGHQAGYLISGISTVLEKKDEQMFYANTFSAIYSDEQFRAEHTRQAPKISGTINAKVDAAASGQYAELDEHGRYKVILPFDRSGRYNGKASAWFRMMQPHAGQNQGMHFPLHKGTEVLLTFIDGNPDRPVIAGAVPNPETTSPVTDENQTKSIISTGQSPTDDSVGAKRRRFGIDNSGEWVEGESDNFIEFQDKTNSRRIHISSKGNLWFRAQNRYMEFHTRKAGKSYSKGSEPKIKDLLDNFDKTSGSYAPTGMQDRHNSNAAQANFHDDVFVNAHVHVSSMDTVNTQEGNIYDFGGYWNYNLGNCYVEGHLDQAATLNADSNATLPDPVAGKKGYQVDNIDPSYDLLNAGGPSWTQVQWSKADGGKLTDDDIKIGEDTHWDNANGPGVLVEKTFGNAYEYTKGNTISISRGDTLDISHGGRHVEVAFRGDGSIKSWTWSESGVSKEKKWNSSGTQTYDMDYTSSTGVTNEKSWNKFTGHMTSNSYSNKETGVKSEHSYCQDTGNELSFNSTHQGANSKHSFDFNWANTAKASFDFAAGAAFTFNASTQGSININLSAAFSLNLNGSLAASYTFNTALKFDFSSTLLDLKLDNDEFVMSCGFGALKIVKNEKESYIALKNGVKLGTYLTPVQLEKKTSIAMTSEGIKLSTKTLDIKM